MLPPVVSLRLLRSDRPLTLRECVPVWLRWLLTTRGYSPLTVRYHAEDLRAFIVYCDGFREPILRQYLAVLASGSSPCGS